MLNTQCYNIRDWLLSEQTIIELDSFDESVFENSVVDSVILLYRNSKNTATCISSKSNLKQVDIDNIQKQNIPISYFLNAPNKQFDLDYSLSKSNLVDKIRENIVLLSCISDTKDGIIQSKIPDKLFLTKDENKFCKPLLFGRDINRYELNHAVNWVDYQLEEMMKIELARHGGGLRLRVKSIFERDKILTRQTADNIITTLDTEEYYYANTLHGTAITDESYDILYVLALLNSKLLNYYYKATTCESGKVFAQVKIEILRQLPIAKTDIARQEPIINKLNAIIAAKQINIDTNQLEAEVDAMVYALYGLTDDEIKLIEGVT